MPSSPPSLRVLGFGLPRATTRADCPRGQGDVLAPACLSHLAKHHPAISASEPHTVATPNPESLQPLGPERRPIHEMPFHPQTLQTVSYFATLPFFSLPSPPLAFSSSTSFHRTSWHCFGLESTAVHATDCRQIYRAKKGIHTSLQKCLGPHCCLIRNGLTSCRVDGLYIDDSILQAD